MTFAKIYPELVESILLCENLGMELVNVTSRTNNLMEEIIEDFNTITLDKPVLYNSSVDSSGASLRPGASLRTVASLRPGASLRPDFMTPLPNNFGFKRSDISKKRTYVVAFGEDLLEEYRYGQHITTDFFVGNIGHTCSNSNEYENDFEAYYRANRNLFNV
jgi:hypothetical protein